MINRLVSLGNLIIDIVAEVPALPARGSDVLASGVALEVGGGFNLMAAAARQGLDVAYGGALGHGLFSDLARRELRAESIALLLPDAPAEQRDSGFDVVLVEPDGERTFVTAVGAEAGGSGSSVPIDPGVCSMRSAPPRRVSRSVSAVWGRQSQGSP